MLEVMGCAQISSVNGSESGVAYLCGPHEWHVSLGLGLGVRVHDQ